MLTRLVEHLIWADDRTIASIATVPSPDPSLLRFQGHILGSQATWIARILGEHSSVPIWPELDLAGCRTLAVQVHGAFRRLLVTLDDPDRPHLVTYSNTKGQTSPAASTTSCTMSCFTHVSSGPGHARRAPAGGEPLPTDFIAFTRELTPGWIAVEEPHSGLLSAHGSASSASGFAGSADVDRLVVPAAPDGGSGHHDTEEDETALRFTGDAGYVSTSGNSSVQTLNLGYRIAARLDAWAFNQQFAVVHGKSRGVTITSLWRGSFRADYTLRPGMSVYALVNYERNVFAGLKSRVSNNAGVAAVALETGRSKLTVEGGVSLTAQRGIPPAGRDLDLSWAGSDIVHPPARPQGNDRQSVELLPNFRDTEDIRVNSESSILAPITKQIGLKLSYVIRYDGLPEVGYETTDRLFTSGIQVSL